MKKRISEMSKLIKAWLVRRKYRKSKRALIMRIADMKSKHMRLCLAGQEANGK
jgi:hypothetical protein